MYCGGGIIRGGRKSLMGILSVLDIKTWKSMHIHIHVYLYIMKIDNISIHIPVYIYICICRYCLFLLFVARFCEMLATPDDPCLHWRGTSLVARWHLQTCVSTGHRYLHFSAGQKRTPKRDNSQSNIINI